MRNHRHFAVVIAILLGTGFLAQRLDTPGASAGNAPPAHHASSPPTSQGAGSDRLYAEALSIRLDSAAESDKLLALTTAMVRLPPVNPPAPRPRPATAVATSPSQGVWAELRRCESDDNYADDTGNGYYGAYQFSLATWRGLGLSGLPSNAPPAEQDQAARELQARHGWGQWPACSAALGLT